MELETHLLIAVRLKYLTDSDVEHALILSAELGRMLAGLIRRLKEIKP